MSEHAAPRIDMHREKMRISARRVRLCLFPRPGSEDPVAGRLVRDAQRGLLDVLIVGRRICLVRKPQASTVSAYAFANDTSRERATGIEPA